VVISLSYILQHRLWSCDVVAPVLLTINLRSHMARMSNPAEYSAEAICAWCPQCCPADDYTSSKLLGSFLMMSQLQHTQPTSAMWLTGAAPNSLAIGLAHKQDVQLPASEQGVGGRADGLGLMHGMCDCVK
jgi:hypothetical protein